MEWTWKAIRQKAFELRHERTYSGEGTRLKYMYFPAPKGPEGRNILLVGFQGCHDKQARYNYVRTCSEFPIHRLFLKDDFAPNGRGSYYIGEHGTYNVERLCHEIVQTFIDRLQPERVLFIGSSKGGYGAINCGIEFPDATIIAGAPQYRLGTYLNKPANYPNLLDIIGEDTPENLERLNHRLERKLAADPYAAGQTCYLHYSNREHTYEKHIRDLLRDLKATGMTVIEDVADYPEHSDVGKYYPHFLSQTVCDIICASSTTKATQEGNENL